MYQIVNCRDYDGGLEEAVRYIHRQWGSERNYAFYYDAISHSPQAPGGIPQFYVMLDREKIIGCFGLIINDFVSRHDLTPWVCSVYVDPAYRGKRLMNLYFEHAKKELAGSDYQTMYLVTDHDGLYEKFGWTRIEDGYDLNGDATRIYKMPVK
ncbi:Acetyltransferase (GNAT) family protein [Vibrio aerogenes CECT 7868]|uniref:Acetyltransferase (GNAT) family protein n=1 Tax=Vibrio aerogenes CECT 7868 TaxID=1216006 RepID=A0A1M5YQQ5_9VIBR|nr:GNAT family N-acetyltransferase [Vibrio aerogenes]SHI14188.1 Acetyltransferase (GNAT) family protein [Vibrio aerogenes CECT 7868]